MSTGQLMRNLKTTAWPPLFVSSILSVIVAL